MKRKINEQPSSQQRAFVTRVGANLHKLKLPGEVLQFWIEHPQLIQRALNRGFDTRLVNECDSSSRAMSGLEKFIWSAPGCWGRNALSAERVIQIKKILIWFFRQSKNFTEEITLRDYIGQTSLSVDKVLALSVDTSYYVHGLVSSCAPIVDFDVVMTGYGCHLYLNSGSGMGCAHVDLTLEVLDSRRCRHISWIEAIESSKTIECPKNE